MVFGERGLTNHHFLLHLVFHLCAPRHMAVYHTGDCIDMSCVGFVPDSNRELFDVLQGVGGTGDPIIGAFCFLSEEGLL